MFVAVTALGAVAALTGKAEPIDPTLDRIIAVLAIAGGVKGLARFKDAVNPPKKKASAEVEVATDTEEPTPGTGAFLVGWAALVVALAIAAIFVGDRHGLGCSRPTSRTTAPSRWWFASARCWSPPWWWSRSWSGCTPPP